MSIPNYARPQLTIKQLLDRTAAATTNRINAIVVGPQYLLSRKDEETLPESPFYASEALIPYSYDVDGVTTPLSDEVVDLDSVKVYAKGLEAVLVSEVSGAGYVYDISKPHALSIDDGWVGNNKHSDLQGRNAKVGDVVYVTDNGKTRRRKIIGFIGTPDPAHFGTNVAKNDEKFSNSASNAATSVATFTTITAPSGTSMACTAAAFDIRENFNRGPRYNGKFGDKFTLTVIQGGNNTTAQVKITSASGLYYKSSLTSTNGGTNVYSFTDVGNELGGLTVNITAAGGLTTGQVFVFSIVGTHTPLPVTESAAPTIKVGGSFGGTKDTTYIVRIVGTNTVADNAAGAVVQVSDTSGLEPTRLLTVGTDGTDQALSSYGLTFQIDLATAGQDFLLVGDSFYVYAVAEHASTTEFGQAILDGPVIDPSVHTDGEIPVELVKIVTVFTGEIEASEAADESAWTADQDGVTVQAGLSLYVPDRNPSYRWVAFDDAIGTLSIQFRALVPPAYGESIITIDDSTDITDQLGTIALENDLAYAASQALAGSQGQRIYALRVGSDDADGFNAAFKKVESTDLVYAFAIISTKEEVKLAAKLHVLSMSEPEKKKFRRAYVGTDSPGEYVKLEKDTNDEYVLGTISSDGTKFVIVTIDPDENPGVDFTTLGLVAGDKVEIAGGSYSILQVLNASQIELKAGPTSAISPAQALVIKKADTPESQVEYVSQVSAGLGTRRVANVWVEGGRKIVDGLTTSSGASRLIPCRFVAAEIAGLRSAVPPQKGLTRTEITSITEATPMHARYTPSLLDEAAAAGTYIVTQDLESGAVFIRHQLTTETDKGSLYYEDSVGVNLDNISFALKDLLEGYIGRYNVNQQTISEIRNKVYQTLTGYTQSEVDTDIGPALVGFDNLVVEADPILKDRINISATLFMPLPLNNIELTLQGSVDLSL